MLEPALLHKDELEHKFAQVLYTPEYYFYTGYPHCITPPEIRPADNHYQYAICSGDKVIGYLAYTVDPFIDCVDSFGLYSFDPGNPLIGKYLFAEMERLVKKYHRVEWKMISGNPAQRSYDAFCKRHNGHVAILQDATKDNDGNYHNVYFYEILNHGKG